MKLVRFLVWGLLPYHLHYSMRSKSEESHYQPYSPSPFNLSNSQELLDLPIRVHGLSEQAQLSNFYSTCYQVVFPFIWNMYLPHRSHQSKGAADEGAPGHCPQPSFRSFVGVHFYFFFFSPRLFKIERWSHVLKAAGTVPSSIPV